MPQGYTGSHERALRRGAKRGVRNAVVVRSRRGRRGAKERGVAEMLKPDSDGVKPFERTESSRLERPAREGGKGGGWVGTFVVRLVPSSVKGSLNRRLSGFGSHRRIRNGDLRDEPRRDKKKRREKEERLALAPATAVRRAGSRRGPAAETSPFAPLLASSKSIAEGSKRRRRWRRPRIGYRPRAKVPRTMERAARAGAEAS